MNQNLAAEQALANYAIGLAGEVGEVLEPLKKYLYHNEFLDRAALKQEVGDVAWYLCAIANALDIDMGEVLTLNVAKLRARYPVGFVGGGADGQVGHHVSLPGEPEITTD
jgi:NTP pyrophosphatase (non-canonical NTP hydrolase)